MKKKNSLTFRIFQRKIIQIDTNCLQKHLIKEKFYLNCVNLYQKKSTNINQKSTKSNFNTIRLNSNNIICKKISFFSCSFLFEQNFQL